MAVTQHQINATNWRLSFNFSKVIKLSRSRVVKTLWFIQNVHVLFLQ